ncbi:hypothetical protein [Halopseudomonas bauzanensis]|uniref:hypothetical protein n=1 Tax=Halopseudomonas bauzanensis TaxID=653930 RepID=UPI000942507B|nr:hypothetical protein [Halopseudomonas bauzanensis]
MGAVFFYFYLVFVTVCFFLATMFFGARRFLSWISLFLCLLMIYSVLLLVFGLSGDVFSLIGDFLRFVFALSVYSYFSGVALSYVCDKEVITKIVVLAVISVAIPLAGVYLISLGGGAVYFGLQSTLALLGVAFGLVYRRYFLLCVSLVLILMSGKRGVMLSSVVVLLAFFYMEALLYRVKTALIITILLSVAIALLVIFDLVPEPILIRLGYLTGDSMDIRMATAGRNEEIEYVVSAIQGNPYAFWFGTGLGSGFVNDLGNFKSTVHFSPAALLLKYGALWAVAIYIVFIALIVRGLLWVKMLGSNGKVYQFWLLVFIGEFIFSFSAYTIFQSFMLWLACAVVSRPRVVCAMS